MLSIRLSTKLNTAAHPFLHAAALALIAGFFVTMVGPSVALAQAYPKPSPYPKSWELDFQHGMPTRVVVQVPGQNVPQAYWYMTYTITNNSDTEQLFLPELRHGAGRRAHHSG